MFREYKPSRAVRSKDSGQLVQSRVQTKHGEAAFSSYAANKWNKLPAEIKLSPNVDIFKSRLKHFSSHVSMHEICTVSFNLSRLLLAFIHLNYFISFSLYSFTYFNAFSAPCCNTFILFKAL